MISTTYFLLQDSDKTVVVHGETGLKLNVFYLNTKAFSPTKGELHLYGDDHGDPLAFETEGYKLENLTIYQGALLWFARYLNYPEMEISESDPTLVLNVRNISKS